MLSRLLTMGAGLSLLVASSTAMALPNAMSSVFDVSRNGLSLGYLKSTLTFKGNKYQYHKSTRATGFAKLLTGAKITEKSEGLFSGDRVIPTSYLYDEVVRKDQRLDKASFAKGRAVGAYKGKSYNLAVPANVLDRGILEMVVANDLNRKLPTLNYTVLDRGELKDYSFVREGSEKLTTNAGTFDTVKISVKRGDGSRETTYWMAKQLDFLPVKMLHKEKGDEISSVLREYTSLEKKP
ncbi:DUF3108 domain-containing protein [Leucothrix arctica]|uniref:DUF3108 domain-containing protein n=1 Tax=Leucothrix arctica TaxID=1481894 RepID=A0A317CD80_9GAMM|nr:DUF3108 domain-containing protein [Leucothrix arctica]PWQ96347.1 hypothetical protein DKT75_10205 [Leucothrix arctica]